MFKELYPSDFISLSFEKATQKYPFTLTTKESIETMGKEIVKLTDNSFFIHGHIKVRNNI